MDSKTSQRVATSVATKGNGPTLEKGKRKVVENTKAEQSYKFKANPLVLRVAFDIEAKR